MSGSITEVGARVLLSGIKEFQKGIAEANKALSSLSGATDTLSAANRAGAVASDDMLAAQQRLAEASAAAAAAQRDYADALVQANALKATGDTDAAAAADANAAAMGRAAAAADAQAAAARRAVTAIGEAEAAAASATAQTDALATSQDIAAASSGRLGTSLEALAGLGKKAFMIVGAAALTIGYESVKAAGNFQSQMTQLNTLAGVAKAQLPAIQKGLLAMAPSVATMPSTLADIAYRVASNNAGLHQSTQALLAQTKAAAQLGKILNLNPSETEQMGRIIGGIKASGISGQGSPAHIAALAAATVGAGDLRGSDLVNFLSTGVAASAQLAGINLPSLLGTLALQGDNLRSGKVSGSAMAHGITIMVSPSGVGTTAYGAVGLSPTEVAQAARGPGQLSGALALLSQHLMAPGMIKPNNFVPGSTTETIGTYLEKYGFTAAQLAEANKVGLGGMGSLGLSLRNIILTRMFGGAKQAIPIELMLTQQKRLSAKTGYIESQATPSVYARDLKRTMSEWNNELGAFESLIDSLGVKIGLWLIPKLESLAKWISKHIGLVEILAGVITGVLVVAIGAWVVSMGAAAVAIIADTWPILLIIGALALVAYGIYELVKHWKQAWGWIKHAVADAVNWITSPLGIGMLLAFLGPAGAIIVGLAEVQKHWHLIWDGIKKATQDGANAVINVIDWFIGVWNATLGNLPGMHITPISQVNFFKNSTNPALNPQLAAMVAKYANVPLPSGPINPAPLLANSGANQMPSNPASLLANSGANQMAPAYAAGGVIGGGLVTNGPRAIVGEGRRAYPEYVVPTDPTHRANALALYHSLGMQLMAGGGILGDITAVLGAITGTGVGSSVGALAVGALANQAIATALGPMVAAADQIANLIPEGVFRNIALGAINTIAGWATQALGIGQSATASATGVATTSGSIGATAAAAPSNPTGNVALGKQMAAQYGWGSGYEWNDLYALWMKESGWSNTAVNPSSGAAGIAQSLGHGYVNLADAQSQIAWGLNYIKGRYGDPAAAWAHEMADNWYAKGGVLGGSAIPRITLDSGGFLPTGWSQVWNGTGAPEPAGQFATGGSSAPFGGVSINMGAGAIVINESANPAKTYAAVKRGIADAVARR